MEKTEKEKRKTCLIWKDLKRLTSLYPNFLNSFFHNSFMLFSSSAAIAVG